MSKFSSVASANPAVKAQTYPDDLEPLIQDELARLADVEARYEADLDRVLRRAKTSRVRDRAVRILAERHRKDREPRVLRLAELHHRMMAMRMFRHRRVQ